ncbi:MAG: winged helix-turn-helix domain-containing protein [Litorimonas sp.]
MYIGEARVNFDANIIDGRNGQQHVEPKIMRLLKFLVENPNTVVSREDLISAVWGVDFGGDERLSRAISLLRKALGEEKGKRKYIETISRGGYRLVADISEEPPEQTTETQNPPPDRAKTFPFQWLIAGLGGALVSALVIFFVFSQSPTTSPTKEVNISAELSSGFDNIRYFGRAGAVKDAQTSFTNILEVDPDNAAAHAGLALSYIREYTSLESDPALLKQARASALNALDKNEHLALSYIAMGWATEFQNEQDKALQYLERADLLDKDNPLILESRMRVLRSIGNTEASNSLVQKAINLHPDVPVFYTYAAGIYVAENDLESAEAQAKLAMNLDPENPWVYSSMAHILYLQGKTTEAIKTVQSGLEVEETASLYNNLGTYLFFQGYYDLAASAFEKTLELKGNSHDPLSWANLGDAYRWIPGKQDLSSQKYNRAIQLWKEGLERSPENLTLKTRIALYNSKLKSGEKPEALLNEVSKTENLESIIYYRMLVTAELWNDRQLALNLLEKSINSGYPLSEIRNDPELKGLREDQAYHLIVSQ